MHAPETLADFRALMSDLPGPDAAAVAAARARDAVLTKPPGALGRLEGLAEWLAGWRGRVALDRVQVAVFAGNHGVAARGVSAFPAEVTVQMVANFHAGGAAVNQLARAFGAEMAVVALLSLGSGAFAAALAAALSAGLVALAASRLIGGQTGDILGASQQLAFAAVLAVAAGGA